MYVSTPNSRITMWAIAKLYIHVFASLFSVHLLTGHLHACMYTGITRGVYGTTADIGDNLLPYSTVLGYSLYACMQLKCRPVHSFICYPSIFSFALPFSFSPVPCKIFSQRPLDRHLTTCPNHRNSTFIQLPKELSKRCSYMCRQISACILLFVWSL